MNSTLHLLAQEASAREEFQRLEQAFKRDALLIDLVNSHTGDISDMQLEHALALQEQLRELELESEEV